MMRRMTPLLLMAIGLGIVSIGLQLHTRWLMGQRAEEQDERLQAHSLLHRTQAERCHELETDLRKVTMAHRRCAKLLRKVALRVPQRPRRLPPPPSWADDDLSTREFDGAETYLPVSFEHDLW